MVRQIITVEFTVETPEFLGDDATFVEIPSHAFKVKAGLDEPVQTTLVAYRTTNVELVED